MKRLNIWFAQPTGEFSKTSILIEEKIMQLPREDKLYNITKTLFDQKKIVAMRLIAYK